jgi:hypothetical protein
LGEKINCVEKNRENLLVDSKKKGLEVNSEKTEYLFTPPENNAEKFTTNR